MAADIFTKAFGDREKWRAACELVNIIDPADIMQTINNRTEMFAQMSQDAKVHPLNTRPQDGSARTHNKWFKTQGPVPFAVTCPKGNLTK